LFILGESFLGYMLGLFVGVYLVCAIPSDPSDRCGLVGLFIVGPIGALMGLALGVYDSQSKNRKKPRD
jgi:hypothetical protein